MKRPNSIIDGHKDQETQNLKEKETATKRRRIEIQIRNREKALKRPMPLTSLTNADPDPESDSNSDSDGNQESITEKIHDELAYQIPKEFKRVMNFMGASSNPSLKLVTEKRLTNGDVDERRNRFLIPERKIRFDFLDLEEEPFLNLKKWRPVEIIEPDCTVSLVTLSKWKTKKGSAYVFVTEWIGLVERNKLQEGELFQLWSFRAGRKYGRRRLCFLLLGMESAEDSGHSSSTESPDDLELTGDNNSDDDDDNSDDVVRMNRSKKIQINNRRSKEMALKRPMSSESESDSGEAAIYEVKRHEDLATVIPESYRRVMSFMGATAADISRLRFVMERRLVQCDVDGRRDLFVIPARKIRWKFLGVVEEEVLKWDKRLTVEMIERFNTVSLVTLRKPAAAAAYVIMEWMELVERNELVAGDTMELWCFRVGQGKYSRLCFMLLQLD